MREASSGVGSLTACGHLAAAAACLSRHFTAVARGPLPSTGWQDGNNLSGPLPPSWSTLPSLQTLFVRPGNERLCMPVGVDFPFRWDA